MNIRGLLRKPNIEFTPDKVTLADLPVARATETVESITPTYAKAADLKKLLEKELTEVENMLNAVASCVPDDPIPVPQEYKGIIELDTVGLHDYLSSTVSMENRDLLIQEIFEDHHTQIKGEPAALLLPILSSQRNALSENLKSMTSSMNSALSYGLDNIADEFDSDSQAFLDSVEYGSGNDPLDITELQLGTLQADINDSRELRAEVMACAEIAAQVMDSDLWPALFDSETTRRIQDGAMDAAKVLKQIRGLLVISATLKATDYRAVVPVLRDYVQRFIVNVQLKIVINTMIGVYRHYVGPTAEIFERIVNSTENFTPKPIIEKYIPKVNRASTSVNNPTPQASNGLLGNYSAMGSTTVTTTYRQESVVQVMHDMAEGCLDVIDSLEDKISDMYICSRKQASLRKKSAIAVSEMIRIKRTIGQLDTIIAALKTATLQPMESMRQEVAPGNLANMLNTYNAPDLDHHLKVRVGDPDYGNIYKLQGKLDTSKLK